MTEFNWDPVIKRRQFPKLLDFQQLPKEGPVQWKMLITRYPVDWAVSVRFA